MENYFFSNNNSTKLITSIKIYGMEKGIDHDNLEKIKAVKIFCRGLLI